jgi:hypothetical protein
LAANVDQVRIDAHAVARAPDAPFEHICHPEFVADPPKVARDTAGVLHHRGTADYL